MIRLTWRQFRAQAAVAIAALVLVAIVSAISEPHLVHLYDTTVSNCPAQGNCSAATAALLRNDSTLRTWLGVLLIAAPGVIGIFWGAPLVASELEGGTFRLAWTQSVTRTRWLAVKLVVVGLASMAITGLLTLVVTWWASPLDRAGMNQFGTFDQRGVVPIGYAAFAFVLGVTAGTLIRRTLPAMAITVVTFVTVRLTFIHWIRPHLIAPALRDIALNQAVDGFGSSNSLFSPFGPSTLQLNTPNIPNVWITSTQMVDQAGRALTPEFLASACPLLGKGGQGGGAGGGHVHRAPAAFGQVLHDCVTRVGVTYHELATYQPANRYWTFQWYEVAIFLGAAVVLAGVCFWWVRRRLT